MNRASDSSFSVLRLASVTICSLCLAVSLVGLGLFTCCTPMATHFLSTQFSRWQGSAFTEAELVSAAEATRDYTVGTHNEDALLELLLNINHNAQEEDQSSTSLQQEFTSLEAADSDEILDVFDALDDSLVLQRDALSHLDDVYAVVSSAQTILSVTGIVGLILAALIALRYGTRVLGRILVGISSIIVVCFLLVALWVAVDFSGFFRFFHSLFFVEGTWTFDSNSLLIRMYPSEFWIGMGVIWFVTTILASLICFILGLSLTSKKKVTS